LRFIADLLDKGMVNNSLAFGKVKEPARRFCDCTSGCMPKEPARPKRPPRAPRSRDSHSKLQPGAAAGLQRLRPLLDDRQPPFDVERFARSSAGALPRTEQASGHSGSAAVRLPMGQRTPAPLRLRGHGGQRRGLRKAWQPAASRLTCILDIFRRTKSSTRTPRQWQLPRLVEHERSESGRKSGAR
jgi:hypothetical protein